MRTTVLLYGAVLAVASLTASTAQAQYRCSPAPSPVDRAACAAAERGPQELRRHVERMRAITTPIYFYDYVNDARARAWDEKARNEKMAGEAARAAMRDVASAATR